MNCAILLAGGKSSRMGADKAFLKFGERSFLDIMTDKLYIPQIDEILVSGKASVLQDAVLMRHDKRIRIVEDMIKDAGPLGGLYSCFQNTDADTALVVSIDNVLITEDTLEYILNSHLNSNEDATVLAHASSIEPLIAAYSTATKAIIKSLIDRNMLSLRDLLGRINTRYIDFRGEATELFNCNSREDYERLLGMRL